MGVKATTMADGEELHIYPPGSASITIRFLKCSPSRMRVAIHAPDSVAVDKWIDDGAKKVELCRAGIDAG